MNTNKNNIRFLVKAATLTALYVVMTLFLGDLSFGIINFRLASMLNHAVIVDRRYAGSIILGCGIANLFSPLGLIDVAVGVSMNAIVLGLSILLVRYWQSLTAKLATVTLLGTVMMFMVAYMLHQLLHIPFWPMYFSAALGQFASLTIGGVLFYITDKRLSWSTLLG